MASNSPAPAPMATTTTTTTTTTSAELLQAQAELWCHTYGYLKSMALKSAIKLKIPTIIHRRGGAASLSELYAALPVPTSKQPYLARLMKVLAASGIFRSDGDKPGVYCLTPVSRLLIEEDDVGDGHITCLSPCPLLSTTPLHFEASQRLAEWLESEADGPLSETPFVMANGTRLYGLVGRDMEFATLFYNSMGADSRFVAEIMTRECSEVFAGVTSLVDVGGGDGTTAKAIAKSFPHVSCSVLELPHVVDRVAVDGTVEFVAGDMMDFVPPADVVLLKFVLHNWNDEDCVQILKRSKEAISSREPKGKVVIIDMVVGSASKEILEAQLLLDLCMMCLFKGEERDVEKWQKIFQDAGFSQYKISPVLGPRSLIELYP